MIMALSTHHTKNYTVYTQKRQHIKRVKNERIPNLDKAFEVLDELGVRRRLLRVLCHIRNPLTTNKSMYMCE